MRLPLRLPGLACLFAATASCEETCGEAVCFGEDESSMVQGIRRDDIPRRSDETQHSHKHSLSALLESTGNMLRNGATPDVLEFTNDVIAEITMTVEPAIENASAADQELVYRMYAMFELALQELEQDNEQIFALNSEQLQHSADHKSCRQEEAVKCEDKIRCDYELYDLWETFVDEETELRIIQRHIDGHFCAPDANGTLFSFRAASVPQMRSFSRQMPRVEYAVVAYQGQHPMCERNFTLLDDKTEDCDARQFALEGISCAHAVRVRTVRNQFACSWQSALDIYSRTVTEVRLNEIDRITEWRTLAVVQCLLNRTAERNGRPCDESTDEADTEFAFCEHVRVTVDIIWLQLIYPEVPELPPACPDHNSVSGRCYPDMPHWPCQDQYIFHEYSSLPDVPMPDFSETNSHCNARPACHPCLEMEIDLPHICSLSGPIAEPPTLPPHGQPATCPGGWEQVGESGAGIGGCGLQSCDERYGTSSEAECAAACEAMADCEGFTFSPQHGDRTHETSTVCTLYNSREPTGRWRGTAGFVQVFCTRVTVPPGTCGLPPDHDNAVGSSDTVPEGGFATYICQEGHSVAGSGVFAQSVRCNANARFGNIIPCLPTICGSAPVVWNAEPAPSTMPLEIVHGMSAVYQCLEGYQLEDRSTLFEVPCDGGIFGAPPVCLPLNCGAPPAIENAAAAAPSETVSYPDRVEYDCLYGYTMDGTIPSSFEISCLASGAFSQGHCEQVQCHVLPTLTNAEWTEESAHRINSGGILSFAVLQYHCIPGYSFTGGADDMSVATRNVECKPSGLYSAVRGCLPINDCQGHSCGPRGVCVDQHMDYTCDCLEGFEIQQVEDAEGNQELVCGNMDDCHGVQCGEGGTCEDLTGDYVCSCRSGFEQIEFEDTKTCDRVECGSPPSIENALVTSNRDGGGKTIFEDQTQYECLVGYSLNGQHDGDRSFVLMCQETGEFSTIPACMPISCGQSEQIEHATVSIDEVLFPNAADYQCAEGYTITGFASGSRSFQKYCTDSGRLLTLSLGQAVLVSCLPVTCGTPPSFDLAIVGNSAVRRLGEVAEYTCIEGHSTDSINPLANSFTSECLSDGSWTDALGYCSPVSCFLPDNTPTFEGLPTVAGQEVSISDFTMPVVYSCKDGYTVDGDPSSDREQVGVCSHQGVLEISPCLPVVCEYGNLVAGAHASAVADARDFTFGETVALRCDAGWEIMEPGSNGADFEVECLASGIFSNPPPCQNIDDCEGHTCGAHGICVDGIQDYSCDCQDGFEESVVLGDNICGNIDDCGGVSCGASGVCTDLVNSFVCDCNSGYANEAGADSVCIPETCELPVVQNSQMLASTTFPFGRMLSVKCLPGYTSEIGSDFRVMCRAGGAVMGTRGDVPTCMPISCGYPPPIVHTETAPDSTHAFVYGETAEYVCEGGTPDITIYCGAHGWDLRSSFYTCQNSCGQPSRPLNGRRNGDGHIFFPQVAQFSCDDGYTHLRSGAFSVDSSVLQQQCLAIGEFETLGAEVSTDENGRIECLPVKCERLAPPANWRWTSDEDFNTRTPATLECEEGYSSNGMPHASTIQSVMCNGDGSQSSLPWPCSPVVHRIIGQISDAVNGELLRNAHVQVTDGSGQPRTLTTSAFGMWSIDNVMRGTVTISMTLTSYTSIEFELNVQDDVEHGIADVALNPEIESANPGNQWRAILSWSQDPLDLDGHITRHPAADGATMGDPGSARTHLYWRNTWAGSRSGWRPDMNKPYLMLDRDNWSGNGSPETITYFQMLSCTHDCKFVYRVWDYCSCTETGMVDNSEAVVRLYNSDGLHSTYTLEQQGSLYSNELQQRWDVFSIDVSGDAPQVVDCGNGNCPSDNTYHGYNHCSCMR